MKRINKNILYILESLSHLNEIYNVLANKARVFALKAEKRMALVPINNHSGFIFKRNINTQL